MSSRTTAFAAQKALVARLQVRTALAGAIVQIGIPAEIPTETDRVYVASIDEVDRTAHPAGFGAAARIFEETYPLTLFLEVHRIDRDSRMVATDRLEEIIAEIEQELADDGELAAGVDDAFIGSFSAFTVPGTDGWYAKSIVNITVTAVTGLA